jgi:nucleotide-binding universal stress UspA family protein
MSGPIVVGVDSSDATTAVRVGVSLARRTRRELVLVHVVEDPPAFPYGSARARELQRRALLAEGTRLLADVAEQAEATGARALVEVGQPVGGLTAVVRTLDADLLVLGSHRRRWLTRLLGRGIAAQLVAHSPCPVVVTPASGRGPAFTGRGPLLLGADGTRSANRATEVAAWLGQQLDRPVLPVCVNATQSLPSSVVRFGSGDRVAAAPLAEIARRAGSPMMVVGTAGGSWLSGSVAQRLIASPRVPVLVVPPPAPVAEQPLAHAA